MSRQNFPDLPRDFHSSIFLFLMNFGFNARIFYFYFDEVRQNCQRPLENKEPNFVLSRRFKINFIYINIYIRMCIYFCLFIYISLYINKQFMLKKVSL